MSKDSMFEGLDMELFEIDFDQQLAEQTLQEQRELEDSRERERFSTDRASPFKEIPIISDSSDMTALLLKIEQQRKKARQIYKDMSPYKVTDRDLKIAQQQQLDYLYRKAREY